MKFLNRGNSALLLAVSLLVIFSSCIDFKHLSRRGKLLFKSKQKTFRGIHFDMSLQNVKEKEELKPDIEYKDYLHYTIQADSIVAGESLDLEYFFNKDDRLDMMIAFYNLADENAIHEFADEIKSYLERKYGRPRQDESGWYHWEFADKGSVPGSIEINLMGETEKGYMGIELELIKYYENEERVRR